jgi:starvation-inducible DNA-binding protein
LKADTREQVSQILNTLLADEHIVYMKLRNYHWNVVGPQFASLHKLFEQQYEEVKLVSDEIAERARMLGKTAVGTLAKMLDLTRLEEAPNDSLDAAGMIADLLKTNEALIRYLRDDITAVTDTYGDEGTADLLIATLRMHEKMAWMLRSLLD